MNKKINISIIIPIYNAESYLKHCLDSVINQQMEMMECICINDGSTDHSLEILNEYANKDHRIKVFSQHNSGPSTARNKGLSEATGEYIWFIDADDWIEKESCEHLYRKAKLENVDILCFCAQVFSVPLNKLIDHLSYGHFGNRISSQKYNKILSFNDYIKFSVRINGVLWNKLFSSKFLQQHNIKLNDDLFINEDRLFYIDAIECRPSILFLQTQYYYYRQNFSDNLIGQMRKPSKKIFDIFLYIKCILNKREKDPETRFKHELLIEAIRHLTGWYGVCHDDNKKAFKQQRRLILKLFPLRGICLYACKRIFDLTRKILNGSICKLKVTIQKGC